MAKRTQKYRKDDKEAVYSYHVTYAFQSESALCSLIDCNWLHSAVA